MRGGRTQRTWRDTFETMQELWQNPFLIWLIFKRRAATYAVSQSTSIVLLLFLFPALYAGWSADLSQLSSLGPWRPAALGLHHTTRARVRTQHPVRVWNAVTSKADPWDQQGWRS
jgi:hypothetical protein